MVKNLYIRLYDPDSRKTLIEYRVTGNMVHETALVISMAFKRAGSWHFKAIGRGLRVSSVRELADKCSAFI